MNFNSMFNMIFKRFIGVAVRKGVDAGVDLAAGRGKPKDQMTAKERQQAGNARQIASRAKQTAKLVRRLMR